MADSAPASSGGAGSLAVSASLESSSKTAVSANTTFGASVYGAPPAGFFGESVGSDVASYIPWIIGGLVVLGLIFVVRR